MLLCTVLFLVGLFLYYKIDKHYHDKRIDNIDRKCVFITGCDTGFGSVLPVRLDAYDVTVFAGCLTEEGAQRLREKCSNNVKPLVVDVTDSDSITQAYQYVKDNIPQGKEFWGVVNNAGYNGPGGPMEFMTRKDYERVFHVNFFGLAEVARIFLPLIKTSRGRIINTSSAVGRLALTMNHPYTSSKWAVEGFSDAIRREKAIYGVQVSIVEPGGFKTGMFEFDAWVAMKEKQWAELPKEIKEEYGEDFLAELKIQRRHFADTLTRPDFTPVINAYDDALFSKHPRYRYKPGRETNLFILIGLLPECASDYIVNKLMKFPMPSALHSK